MAAPELHPDLDEGQRTALLRQGVELFNRGSYFAAHEPWEEIWRSTNPEPRDLFRGLVQVAAALYHWHERRNATAAARVLGRGLKLLAAFRPRVLGLDVERFLEDLAPWQRWLEDTVGPAPPAPRLRGG